METSGATAARRSTAVAVAWVIRRVGMVVRRPTSLSLRKKVVRSRQVVNPLNSRSPGRWAVTAGNGIVGWLAGRLQAVCHVPTMVSAEHWVTLNRNVTMSLPVCARRKVPVRQAGKLQKAAGITRVMRNASKVRRSCSANQLGRCCQAMPRFGVWGAAMAVRRVTVIRVTGRSTGGSNGRCVKGAGGVGVVRASLNQRHTQGVTAARSLRRHSGVGCGHSAGSAWVAAGSGLFVQPACQRV